MKRILRTSIVIALGWIYAVGLSSSPAGVREDLSLPAQPESAAVSDRPEDQEPDTASVPIEEKALSEPILETDFTAAYDGDRYPGTQKGKRYHVCEDGFVEVVLDQEDRSDWPFGKIHPSLLTETEAPQQVIVELRQKPFGALRQRLDSPRKAVIEDLQSQIRQLTARPDAGKKIQTRAEEKQAASEQVMTQAKKQQLRRLHLQLDREMDARRKEAFEAAMEESRPLREQMRAMIEQHQGQVTGGSGLMNCLGAVLPGSALEALAQSDLVESIVPDYEAVLDLDESACTLEVDEFWDNGYDGGAYDAAVIDAGIRETHHYLRYKDPINLLNERPIYKRIAGYVDPHGTRTAGVIASTHSTYQGIAFGLDALFDSQGHGGNTESYLMDAIDWVFSCTTCGGQDPEVINTSFSIYDHDAEFGILERFYDAIISDLDVMITKSAGNAGLTELGYPQASNSISVANLDIDDTCSAADDVITSSSSRGPTDSGRRKPDITAPGTDTYVPSSGSDTYFANHGGTSAAAPHAAGAVMLLTDAGILSPKAQKAILINTAQTWSDNDTLSIYTDDGPVGGDRWDETYGWGVMDLWHAYFHRNDWFSDSIIGNDNQPDDDDYKLYEGYMYTNDKATVVWQRRAVYNGDSEPTTYYTTTDINMRVYNADTGSLLDWDTIHSGNNVHQVSAGGNQNVVIKVYTQSTGIDGAAAEPYVLATEEGFSRAEPPLLSVTLSMPSVIDYNTNFTVWAYVTNSGDVSAFSVTATLNLPSGFTLISGSNPRSVGTIEAGHTSVAGWTVRSGGTAGIHTVSVSASSTCYLETYTGIGERMIDVGPAAWPDLEPITRTGWSYPIVPRDSGGAIGTSCLITATLPGNTVNTNFNWAWTNSGAMAAGTHSTSLYVDDVWFFSSSTALDPGEDQYHNNVTKPSVAVSGGRHTIHYQIDTADAVAESDETNNIYSRQFVWSPYWLTDDAPIERSAPPKRDSTGFQWYNNDGFSFDLAYSGNDKWWSVVGVLPGGVASDYAMRLWDIGDYTGSEDGFGGGALEFSGTYLAGNSEFVMVNDNQAAAGTYFAGVINWNAGTDVFRIEEDTSVLIDPRPGTEWNGPYAKVGHNVLDVYEVYLTVGEYVFVLDQTSGDCDLGMSLYDRTTIHAKKSEYMTDAYANNGGDGEDESFQIEIPAIGYYGLVIWKVDSSDYAKTASYRIAVGPPALTLTYPNGGETIMAGSPIDITWDNFGNTDHNVRIEISRNNGTSWSAITSSTSNDGSYSWTAALPGSTQCLIRITSTSDPSYTDTSDAVFTIDAAGIPAEIEVRQDGTLVPHKSDYDFGRVNLGYSVSREFTIRNLGGADLLLDGSPKVQVYGTDASYFVVTAQPTSPVGSMGTTTFEIEFTPTSLRSYTATVEIPNSDADEDPYSFKLNGLGSKPRRWYVDDDAPSDPGPNDPSVSDPAEDGSSGHPFDMVQEAVDAAFHEDMVIVREGRYIENIDLLGKNILVTGEDPDDPSVVNSTVLDGFGKGSVVSFVSGESSDCVLEGFTIIRGGGSRVIFAGIKTLAGGAIFCVGSDPVVRKCVLAYNQSELGGAVYASGSACEMTLEDCRLYKNIAANYHSGGIYLCNGAEMLIQRNAIHTNRATSGGGGGIAIQSGARAQILDNDIYDNEAGSGGGIMVSNSSATTLSHNCIYENQAAEKGGAVKLWGAPIQSEHDVYYGNTAGMEGGAVQCAYTSGALFTNSIFWNNSAPAGENIYLRYNESSTPYASVLTVQYSDLENGLASCVEELGTTLNYGPDNYDANPLFADAAGGDFHLLSEYGRWDPAGEVWVTDSLTSKCIDAGDPADPDWTEELWPHGKQVNMGAYGGTPQASMSWSSLGNVCDIDDDGEVDLDDLALLAIQWTDTDLLIPENTDHTGIVNYEDFSLCSRNWLWIE